MGEQKVRVGCDVRVSVYMRQTPVGGQSKYRAKLTQDLILIIISTGARLIEALKMSNFEQVKGKPRLVQVIGFAKKSGLSGSKTTYVVKPIVGIHITG